MKCNNIAVLNNSNIEMVRRWNVELLNIWHVDILKCWKGEILKCFNFEKCWNAEVLTFWNVEMFLSMNETIIIIIVVVGKSTLKCWSCETLDLEKLLCWSVELQKWWSLEVLKCWKCNHEMLTCLNLEQAHQGSKIQMW